MKVITKYEANDGTVFDTEQECLDYEATKEKFVAAARFMHEFCKKFSGVKCSDGCPFAENSKYDTECLICDMCPADWVVPSE